MLFVKSQVVNATAHSLLKELSFNSEWAVTFTTLASSLTIS